MDQDQQSPSTSPQQPTNPVPADTGATVPTTSPDMGMATPPVDTGAPVPPVSNSPNQQPQVGVPASGMSAGATSGKSKSTFLIIVGVVVLALIGAILFIAL